jgi:dipeptidyl aminopeptidase/acylaminoacyl peptidase
MVAAAGLLTLLAVVGLSVPQAADTVSDAERLEVFRKYLDFGSYLHGGRVTPYWMSDGDRFWYADEEGGHTTYRLVDPNSATVTDLFDLTRLRETVRSVTGETGGGDGLPFDRFEFSASFGDQVTFELDGQYWELDLATYAMRAARGPEIPTRPRRVSRLAGVPSRFMEVPSPDGRWMATLVDENLALRESGTDSLVVLTTDGTVDQPWAFGYFGLTAYWSPDSRYLMAGRRANPITERWPLVRYPSWEEVAKDGYAPEVEMWPISTWAKTAEAMELHVFDLRTGARTRVGIEPLPGQGLWPVEWIPDGSGVLVRRRSPSGEAVDLLVVNPRDGSVRVLDSMSVDGRPAPNISSWSFLEDDRRFLAVSDRNGYPNLYLFDVQDGFVRAITSGQDPVGWFHAHEATGWVYLVARTDENRPYDQHLARVPLDGGDMEILASEAGQHSISLSPSGQYFLDRHVANDRPMRTDLKAADGRFIMTVEAGSVDQIREELRWSPPEEFSVLAPDGVTELYGTLFKPWDFDPSRSYPVVDYFWQLHALGSVVLRPDQIGRALQIGQAVAQLGFVVVTFDTRGSAGRGRDFRLSMWGRGDEEIIPEHVHVLRRLAAERPWMDLERVGALGHSNFGRLAARAMLMAPDFYRVGVSSAGPDPQDAVGLDPPNLQAEARTHPFRSNSSMAANLEGRLLLTVGTDDVNAPLYVMMPLLDALVRAGKQFDFKLIPGAGHSMFFPGSPFSDYFWEAVAEHLLKYLRN